MATAGVEVRPLDQESGCSCQNGSLSGEGTITSKTLKPKSQHGAGSCRNCKEESRGRKVGKRARCTCSSGGQFPGNFWNFPCG